MADTESPLVYIGIDSSTTCTGISVIADSGKKESVLQYLKVYPGDGSYQQKCVIIYDAIKSMYIKYKSKNPIVTIELLNSQKNMDTTRKLAGLWGFIVTSLYNDFNINVHSINTSQAKKESTGDGGADKQKVIKYINKYFNLKLKFSNKKEDSDDDIADAISVALAAIRLARKGELK